MDYTVIIGLEIHVQLQTRTKLFCPCLNRFNPENPNSQTCPVCLGLPGALPVMNRHALELALQTAIALNCDISEFTKWDRKQYYYPDLPKAYQISQYDLPFSHDGYLELPVNDEEKPRRIGIIRAHLEEDAGKNIHDETGRGKDSQVDLNRCGTPLVEIVTEPDLRSPQEARQFLEELRLLLMYLQVSDCNMQEGSLRCDANINLHIHTEDGHSIPTPITEIKNLNSFRNVELACEFEVSRQLKHWQETGIRLGDPKGMKSTRGWDARREVTFEQRGKEEAADYRYFPDPDLVPITIPAERVQEIKGSLCEFPADRRKRFQAAYQISHYDASVVIDQGEAFANYFEHVALNCGDGKQAANWVTQDVLREMKERNQSIETFAIPAPVLATLLQQIVADKITIKSAREVFQTLLADADMGADHPEEARIEQIIAEKGLAKVSDTGELDRVIDQVMEKNADAVESFRSGKQGAIGPLIGQVMKQLKGADASAVRQRIVEKIGS